LARLVASVAIVLHQLLAIGGLCQGAKLENCHPERSEGPAVPASEETADDSGDPSATDTHDTYAVFLDDYLPKAGPVRQDAEYFSGLKTYENVRWLAENNEYLANSSNRPTSPLLRPFVMLSTGNREAIGFVNSYKVELQHQMQAQFENFKAAQLNKLGSLPSDDDRIDSLHKLAALGLYLGEVQVR
jgi:hypothetical protein